MGTDVGVTSISLRQPCISEAAATNAPSGPSCISVFFVVAGRSRNEPIPSTCTTGHGGGSRRVRGACGSKKKKRPEPGRRWAKPRATTLRPPSSNHAAEVPKKSLVFPRLRRAATEAPLVRRARNKRGVGARKNSRDNTKLTPQ